MICDIFQRKKSLILTKAAFIWSNTENTNFIVLQYVLHGLTVEMEIIKRNNAQTNRQSLPKLTSLLELLLSS